MPLRDIVVGRDLEDLEKYGGKGTIYFGKHIVGKGEEAHLTNAVKLDVARPHIMLICGKRGSGKSYSGCVIAEEISKLPEEIRNNISVLLIDTQGIFWSMKNPNEKQITLLNEWSLKPRSFDVKVFIPKGFEERFKKADIPYDKVFTIRPSDLSSEDWVLSFDISLVEPLGILLDRSIKKLKEKGNYSIDEIADTISKDERADKKEKEALTNRFLSAKDWGIFSAKGTEISELLEPGKISILDVSFFGQISEGWSVRTLLVGLLCRSIYQLRVEARRTEEISTIGGFKEVKAPLVWIITDEAHNFIPAEGKTAASAPLLTLIKQGRQPGISCAFITQRPNKLHEDAISQADLVVSHRLTAEPDLKALQSIMQTYLLFDIGKSIGDLPKESGAAIVLDDNSERIYSIKVRPRQSWHAGGTPTAIPEEEE